MVAMKEFVSYIFVFIRHPRQYMWVQLEVTRTFTCCFNQYLVHDMIDK